MWTWREWWAEEEHGMGKEERRTIKGGDLSVGGVWRWLPGIVSISGGGGRGRRACLALALICCSPVLLPLICLSLPLICIAALCLRLHRRRRPAGLREDDDGGGGGGGGLPGRCKEGEAAVAIEGRLLQRYLEDQLGLVGPVWDCDDGDGC